MGTWGYKTFENDAASDWLYELEEAKNPSFLLKSLRAVSRARGKPDLDDSLESLAAAEVIAGARYDPPKDVPSIARKWIRRVGFCPNNATVNLALRAVGKVGRDSDLADVWQGAGKLARWRKAVGQLNRHLRLALKASRPKRAANPVETRQTLAELIIEVAANPTSERREELCKKLAKLSNPNRPVGGRGLNALTPLHWVAARGMVKEAQLLVTRGAIVDIEISCMARPIGFALENKQYAMVDYLIEAGADKEYALLKAIQHNQINLAQKLVNAGADLHFKNEGRCTLLHFAATAGAAKSIGWLLEQGLKVNAKDCAGGSALHDAVHKPSLAAVKVLVKHGADIHLKNQDGETPLDAATAESIPRSIFRFLHHRAP